MKEFNPELVICVTDGRRLKPCDWLAKAIQSGHPTPKAKGIFKPDRVILSTGEPGTDVVQVHSGDYIGRGVAANYCPFCGADIRTWMAPDSKMTVKDGESEN